MAKTDPARGAREQNELDRRRPEHVADAGAHRKRHREEQGQEHARRARDLPQRIFVFVFVGPLRQRREERCEDDHDHHSEDEPRLVSMREDPAVLIDGGREET
jgi:hypothetical protein